MKAKLFVSLLLVVLLMQMCMLTINVNAGDSPVKVAVYVESQIDESERANVVDALGVVEARFEDQIGYEVDFEIVGSWVSRKDTDDPTVLLEDAISKTDGIQTYLWDNIGRIV